MTKRKKKRGLGRVSASGANGGSGAGRGHREAGNAANPTAAAAENRSPDPVVASAAQRSVGPEIQAGQAVCSGESAPAGEACAGDVGRGNVGATESERVQEPARHVLPTDDEVKSELWKLATGDASDGSRVSALRTLADIMGLRQQAKPPPEFPAAMLVYMDALAIGLADPPETGAETGAVAARQLE